MGSEMCIRDRERSILEKAARRADVVQYVLVLLGDLLEGMFFLLAFFFFFFFVFVLVLWRVGELG